MVSVSTDNPCAATSFMKSVWASSFAAVYGTFAEKHCGVQGRQWSRRTDRYKGGTFGCQPCLCEVGTSGC